MINGNGKRIPWRKNLLALIIIAYVTILVIFVTMIAYSGNAAGVWDAIEAPLMALIGGTLAIAKDLIPAKEGHEDDQCRFPAGGKP